MTKSFYFLLFFSFFVRCLFAQTEITKVERLPTGQRFLINVKDCEKLHWKDFSEDVSFVQIEIPLLFCQEFADFAVQNTNNTSGVERTWGKPSTSSTQVSNTKPSQYFYQKEWEQDLIVLPLQLGESRVFLEEKIKSQCREAKDNWDKNLDGQHQQIPSDCMTK